MAYFAKLDENNVVIGIHAVNNEILDSENEEISGIQFLTNLHNYARWVQTSYNNRIRKQYAGIGFTYDSEANVFVAPKPFASWFLDENYDWQPPIPMPSEGFWIWDEELGNWINA